MLISSDACLYSLVTINNSYNELLLGCTLRNLCRQILTNCLNWMHRKWYLRISRIWKMQVWRPMHMYGLMSPVLLSNALVSHFLVLHYYQLFLRKPIYLYFMGLIFFWEWIETFPSIGRVRVKHREILLTLKGTVIRSGAIKMIEGEKIYECRVCKHRSDLWRLYTWFFLLD